MQFTSASTGRKRQSAQPATASPRVPRVKRLLALAHRIEDLVRRGEVPNYAIVGEVGGVTRARVTQVVGLLNLCPAIQIAILDLPAVQRGRDPITERDLRPIASEILWKRQRAMWKALLTRKRIELPR